MAKQTVNLGTTANDGTGDPLRSAFDKLNDNFDEVYGNSFVDTANIADDAVTADKLANSINTEITANTAKVTNATHTGDVTGSTALTISNDVVDQDQLANRYKGIASSSTTTSQNLDCSSASTFQLTGAMGTATLTISGIKKGQSIDILFFAISGSASLTLSSGFTTDTFYRVGSGEFDTTAYNIIQVTCLDDDDSNAKLAYSVAQLVVDFTP
jgi:hypothetical protein